MKKNSLLFKLVSRIGFIFFTCSLIVGVVSGFLMYNKTTTNFNSQIVRENQLRADKESILFKNSVLKLDILKERIIKEMNTDTPYLRFDNQMAKLDDKSWRTNPQTVDSPFQAIGFISSVNKNLSPEFKKLFMKTYGLINEIGNNNRNDYYMTWAVFPNDSNIAYCDKNPRANYEIPSNFSDTKENYWKQSTKQIDPNQSGLWIKPYYDPSFEVWMVSYVVPIYIDDKHVMTIGFDISLKNIFENVLKAESADHYNFLVSNEGDIIVHPKQGKTNNASALLTLKDLDPSAGKLNLVSKLGYVENSDNKFAISKIEGTNWKFVSVYNNRDFWSMLGSTAVWLGLILMFCGILFWAIILILKQTLIKDLENLTKNMAENTKNLKMNFIAKPDTVELQKMVQNYNELIGNIQAKTKEINSFNSTLQGKLHIAINKNLANTKASMINEIVSDLSQDITGPLSVIKFNLERIQDKVIQKNITSDDGSFMRSQDAMVKIQRVISKLVLLGKSPNKEKFTQQTLSNIFSQISEIYESKFKDLKIEFKCEYDKELVVQCKEGSLLQSFISLLNNSIDSIKLLDANDPRKITISTQVLHSTLMIKIQDSGKKIPKDYASRIMDHGFSTKRDRSGVGLTTCRAMADDHNGEIYLDTKESETTFVMMLPLKQPTCSVKSAS